MDEKKSPQPQHDDVLRPAPARPIPEPPKPATPATGRRGDFPPEKPVPQAKPAEPSNPNPGVHAHGGAENPNANETPATGAAESPDAPPQNVTVKHSDHIPPGTTATS